MYARLAQGNWPQLTYLSLAGHGMDEHCAAQLVNADWPKLQTQDPTTASAQTAARARLAQGNWPLLNIGVRADCRLNWLRLNHRILSTQGLKDILALA